MNDHLEDRLRAELNRRAEHAPTGTLLAEQIIAAARTQPRPQTRRGWPTWTLPLLAAGAVAAIVTGVFVGVSAIRNTANPAPPVASLSGTSAPTDPAPSSSPAISAPVLPAPTTRQDGTPTGTRTDATTTLGLHNVQLLDLTFASTDHGFALASADCVSGPGRCTALLRTADGTTWTSMPGAAFNVAGVNDCADPCVTNLRYATDDIGYAFGPSAFFLTTDGGGHWTRQAGGARELETLNGYVLRIKTDDAACSWCGVLERSSIGGTSWTPIDRPAPVSAQDVGGLFDLGFAGHLALIEVNLDANHSNLFVSPDGSTWSDQGKLCREDPIHLSGASDGSIAVDCGSHEGGSAFVPDYVAVSTDGGATFGPARTIRPAGGYADAMVAVSASTILVARDGVLRRSTDGGQTWNTVAPTGKIDFLGFESDQVGRAVSDGTTIWTTRDGGASWKPVSFS